MRVLVQSFDDVRRALESIRLRRWQAYAPLWTADTVDPALGDGVLTGRYWSAMGLCVAAVNLTIGSTTTLGTGSWRLSLPMAPDNPVVNVIGQAFAVDAGMQSYPGICRLVAGQDVVYPWLADASPAAAAATPFAWVAGDKLELTISYPVP